MHHTHRDMLQVMRMINVSQRALSRGKLQGAVVRCGHRICVYPFTGQSGGREAATNFIDVAKLHQG